MSFWGKNALRKKDVITFDHGDSGKTTYFAIQVENDGKEGDLGAVAIGIDPLKVQEIKL
jgi:hypothetical protein